MDVVHRTMRVALYPTRMHYLEESENVIHLPLEGPISRRFSDWKCPASTVVDLPVIAGLLPIASSPRFLHLQQLLLPLYHVLRRPGVTPPPSPGPTPVPSSARTSRCIICGLVVAVNIESSVIFVTIISEG